LGEKLTIIIINEIINLEKAFSKNAKFEDKTESKNRHPTAAPAVILQKRFFKFKTMATNHKIRKFISKFIKKTKSKYNIIMEVTPD